MKGEHDYGTRVKIHKATGLTVGMKWLEPNREIKRTKVDNVKFLKAQQEAKVPNFHSLQLINP